MKQCLIGIGRSIGRGHLAEQLLPTPEIHGRWQLLVTVLKIRK